uniref:Cytochrome b561 bacterial/Ni-hydrogenase domain-containing protein n=1 Tax=Chlamydomonas euryale TaxID=1486919 RepID=A0A7R9VZQ2_9CHLO|mmetsp:Transcript_7438/g.22554  ORF Transcript_7438/g.22554 Transcript_7438/m.22554 type:complete len:177 (+) Transcript_7438:297-827(+)
MVYSRAVSAMHWAVAPAMMGTVGSVLAAQQAEGPRKGELMHLHKSLGLLTGMLVVPRLAIKLSSKLPPAVHGPAWEQMAGAVSHNVMYVWMVLMPATGIAMGYYGGKGLPFFSTTFAGAETPNGGVAKQAFWMHKQAGIYGKYLIPLHLAGTAKHLVIDRNNILKRINPFSFASSA